MSHIFETSEDEWSRLKCAEILLQIEPNNKTVITALLQILETTQNEWTSLSVAEIMLEIDNHRQKALDALVRVTKTTENGGILRCATESIERLYSNNKIPKPLLDPAIFSLVESFQTYKDDDYESLLLSISDRLSQILPSECLPKIVIILKHCLSEQFYKSSSYRYEAAFKLIWHCAENMNYPAFYKACHN